MVVNAGAAADTALGAPREPVKELSGLDPFTSEDRERLSLGLKAYRMIAPSLPH